MLQTYAKNRLTWPMALGFTFITWILNAWVGLGGRGTHTVVLSPFFDSLLGMGVCALAVYMIAELNTRFSLLSNSDRTITTTLMLLIAMAMYLHPLQPAQLVMVSYLAGYMVMLDAYQSRVAPVKSFVACLMLGIGSLACPQLVWFMSVILVSFVILRAGGLKSVVAAVLGIMAPYWFWKGISVITGSGLFSAHLSRMTAFGSGGLGLLSAKELWSFWIVLALFLIGAVHFFMSIHQNRSRTRVNYYVVCLQGACAFLFLWVEPQLFRCLIPLCMVNAAILFGNFCSYAKGRVPDVTLSILAILWLITTLIIK